MDNLFIQHYNLITDSIESHILKDSYHNQLLKNASKYISTMTTSAISKYLGCDLHNPQYLQQALSMAHRNYQNKLTCIFK